MAFLHYSNEAASIPESLGSRLPSSRKKRKSGNEVGNKIVLCTIELLTSLSSLSVIVLSISHVMR